MIVRDLRYFVPEAEIFADLCIVGAGPAGLVLAEELAGHGLKIVVVESGQFGDGTADDLNLIENIGIDRIDDQRRVRRRTVGGASQIWYGRVAALDNDDFTSRDWVPNSGWPISRDELKPYYERAAAYLGLSVSDNTDRAALAPFHLPAVPFDRRLLTNYYWLMARHGRLGNEPVKFGDRVRRTALDGVMCVTEATATQLVLASDGSAVASVEVTGPDGHRRHLRSQQVVLAAGGIENARLLLASNRQDQRGVGNEHDQVGRHLMDHPRGVIAEVDATDPRAIHALSAGTRRTMGNTSLSVRPGMALSADQQRRGRLLNCAAWVDWASSDTDPWHYLRKPENLGHPSEYLRVGIRGLPLIGRSAIDYVARGRMPIHDIRAAKIECIVEQAPYSDSRVTLSSRTDRYGMAISRIDWRLGELELTTVRRMGEIIRSEFARLGLPHVGLIRDVTEGGALRLPDNAHPIGTTRMSAHADSGVVDVDGRVHGLLNLHIAGSSVFPTGGHANPTHTILALTIRLADQLRATFAGWAPRVEPDSAIRPAGVDSMAEAATGVPESPRPLALVTGASGKIGTQVLDRLIAAGWRVRAMSSRSGHLPTSDVEWIVRDLRRDDLDFAAEVEGVDAVIHLGAELHHERDMWRTNAEATGALVEASERAGIGTFCYVSSVSVYGSSRNRLVSEDSEVLTSRRDLHRECLGDRSLRSYGRSKLAGEEALRRTARAIRYIVLRPTVVVDQSDLQRLARRNLVRRAISTFRRTQHIYVDDVAAAIVWSLLDADAVVSPGQIVTFNVSDEADSRPFFGQAFGGAVGSFLARSSLLRTTATVLDIIGLSVKYHAVGVFRFPLAHAQYSSAKLQRAGFEYEIGMDRARIQSGALRKAS